jgi:hypothetical protein
MVPEADGVPQAVEDGAPNNGDGNNDGTPDSQQSNVTSLPNAVSEQYITLASTLGTTLVDVQSTAALPAPLPIEGETPLGLIEFAVDGIANGARAEVVIYVPTGVLVNQYWKYGPAGWYQFDWDEESETGAVFEDLNSDGTDDITLYFKDGMRGDDDGAPNGIILDPGIEVYVPPTLESITYFNSNAALERNFTSNATGQRSIIKRIEVVFNGEVELSSSQVTNGFVLSAIGLGNVPIQLETSSFNQVTRKTTVVLKVLAGSYSDAVGLKDGNYRLNINGAVLRVDADSSSATNINRVDDFYRYFGDSDGDRDVDATDYNRFRQANATAGMQALDFLFDFDDDGNTDADNDTTQFRLRLGRRLNP